jgi:hypothetical protein
VTSEFNTSVRTDDFICNAKFSSLDCGTAGLEPERVDEGEGNAVESIALVGPSMAPSSR